MKRRKYVKPGDTRSALVRLLSTATPDGYVEVHYHQQWRTLFKAQRLGLLDDYCRLTDGGSDWLAKQKEIQ